MKQQLFSQSVVTIGNFDGVHLGHQEILSQAKIVAERKGLRCLVFTFFPHPCSVLKSDFLPSLLSTQFEKNNFLKKLGADQIIEQVFDLDFASLSAEDFFNSILLNQLKAETLVVGYDFAFGKARSGTLDLLKKLCKKKKVNLMVVPPCKNGSIIISSSKIRELLLCGEIEIANDFLGRFFSYQGTVVKGKGRGKLLGFPTANLEWEEKLVLPYGVYATYTTINQVRYLSVTNIGVRPTFVHSLENKNGNPLVIETHLIDASCDLYDKILLIEFVSFIRKEIKFSDKKDLVQQIQKDIEFRKTHLFRCPSGQ